jgi:hypothetical protein
VRCITWPNQQQTLIEDKPPATNAFSQARTRRPWSREYLLPLGRRDLVDFLEVVAATTSLTLILAAGAWTIRGSMYRRAIR